VKSSAHAYYLANGDRVPGVTTVIGDSLGWKTPGLVHWAWKLGMENKNYREVREEAANAGKLCHLMAQCDIQGKPMPDLMNYPPEIAMKARESFKAWLDWKAQTRLELIAAETPLVSEAHGYGGKPDAIAAWTGEVQLLDWKSAKDLYPDTIVQVAAYKELWNECRPQTPIKRCHVLRWNEDGGFNHHSLSERQIIAGWRAFVHCLQLYKLKPILKG
jgi:hypothetical protein